MPPIKGSLFRQFKPAFSISGGLVFHPSFADKLPSDSLGLIPHLLRQFWTVVAVVFAAVAL